jgi:hypothetical protein
MTRSNRSPLRAALQRAAACGLLVLAMHVINGPLPQLAADDGVVRIDSPASEFYAHANCAKYDPDMLNLDNSFGIGRGRIPFDRWYYLRLALGYKRIYPADIGYSDPRDRRVYSAWGYGVPLAVPLPSNVVYQYNYSQGPQGSRLTPVSRPGR